MRNRRYLNEGFKIFEIWLVNQTCHKIVELRLMGFKIEQSVWLLVWALLSPFGVCVARPSCMGETLVIVLVYSIGSIPCSLTTPCDNICTSSILRSRLVIETTYLVREIVRSRDGTNGWYRQLINLLPSLPSLPCCKKEETGLCRFSVSGGGNTAGKLLLDCVPAW